MLRGPKRDGRARVALPLFLTIFLHLAQEGEALNTTSGRISVGGDNSPPRWTYWSNAQVGEFAHLMQTLYPDYCRVRSIGKSVQGQDLWVLTASRIRGVVPGGHRVNVTPSFLYVGNMHGNEPLGRQLMIYLAEELCAGAGSGIDPEITKILSNGAVHLLFSMNPDGFDARRRENGNGVDLNRNLPDQIKSHGNLTLTGAEEPETKAVLKFAESLRGSLVGASLLHEGALVVNYPLDGAASGSTIHREPNPSDDDALFRYLAQQYVGVQPELTSEKNREFQEGMVQGSMWYPVYGGLQDYLYLVYGAYTTTIEMNDQKWPEEKELPRLWLQHRESMYAFLKAYLNQGITVKVDVGVDGLSKVSVEMLTAQMGKTFSFYQSKDFSGIQAVHYPVPEGTYNVLVHWIYANNATKPKILNLQLEVKENERTVATAKPPNPVILVPEPPSLGPPEFVSAVAYGEARAPSEAPAAAAERFSEETFGDLPESWDFGGSSNPGRNRMSWRASKAASAEIFQASRVSSALMLVLFFALGLLLVIRKHREGTAANRGGRASRTRRIIQV